MHILALMAFIDVDKIIKTKNPALHKWLPSFMLNYIKRTIHQDEINEILERHKGIEDYDFCESIIKEWEIEVEVHGLENVPEKGGYIFPANHPLGGMDALALATILRGHRDDIKFFANDLLMNIENLQGMFVAVNKLGRNSSDFLKASNEAFASDNAVFIWPAGLVSRRKNGKVRDLDWKKTFISRAKKFRKDIIPVFITGELSNFFYNLSNFRQWIGLKANIEMFFLADELFKQKGKKIDIYFGEIIPCASLDDRKSDKEWADIVKEKVYALKSSLK